MWALGLGVWTASPAGAGGLYSNEYATSIQGNARAGAVAWANDASFALHNPAGMTKLDDHAFASGFALAVANIKFDYSQNPRGGGNGGEQGGLGPLSSLNYVHRISDRLRFGFTFFSLSGSILDPSNNWAARFELTELSLLTISMSPTLGIRLTDWLSIGGGPVITRGVLDWKLRAPGPREGNIRLDELDDWEPSGRVGALFHPVEAFSLGVFYQSETEFDLDGDIKLPVGVSPGIELDLPLAQFVEVGAHWQATDRLGLLFTFIWEDWSAFDNLPVSLERVDAKVSTGWEDTYKVAAGAQWQLNERWLLQTGVSYDTTPVKNKDRITALPVDQQVRFALGALFDLTDSLQVGANFVYAWLGEGKVRTSFVRGDYQRNNLFVFGLTISAKKLPWSGKATFNGL